MVFKYHNSIKKHLVNIKGKVNYMNKQGVVYKIPCAVCDLCYIGETGRSLSVRIKEHKYAVRTMNMNNAIAVHANDTGHLPNWDKAEILNIEADTRKRKILEAINIGKVGTINLDAGFRINPVWRSILD